MAALLVSTISGWEVKQLCPVLELELDEDTRPLAKQINALSGATRTRTGGSDKLYPNTFVPEYSVPLENHPWQN
eukprot:14550-Pleurochrysis_carterae.AAC.1